MVTWYESIIVGTVQAITKVEREQWNPSNPEDWGRWVEYTVKVDESLVPFQEIANQLAMSEWRWSDDDMAMLRVGSRYVFFLQSAPREATAQIDLATFDIDSCGQLQDRFDRYAANVWEKLEGLPLEDVESVLAEVP